MTETTTIDALPNEILVAVLSSFNTTTLLPFALICHRFYDITVRILHTRLLDASVLQGHRLILKCSHPSTRTITPYLFVANLGIGTRDHVETGSRLPLNGDGTDKLGKLRGLYSHFRPILPEEIHRSRRRLAGSWALDTSNSLSEVQTEYVCQNVLLESHELFSQLYTVTNMVKVGLTPGTYLSCMNISGGVVRVWRDWLAERCSSAKCGGSCSGQHAKGGIDEEYRKGLLWADPRENVGLRMRVLERQDIPPPILAPPEEIPVSYTLQYEELVIRTTELLLALERSSDQESRISSQGVIIRPWC